jgi:hypothetical protein
MNPACFPSRGIAIPLSFNGGQFGEVRNGNPTAGTPESPVPELWKMPQKMEYQPVAEDTARWVCLPNMRLQGQTGKRIMKIPPPRVISSVLRLALLGIRQPQKVVTIKNIKRVLILKYFFVKRKDGDNDIYMAESEERAREITKIPEDTDEEFLYELTETKFKDEGRLMTAK